MPEVATQTGVSETHMNARSQSRLDKMNQISGSLDEQRAEDFDVPIEDISGKAVNESIADDPPKEKIKEEDQVTKAFADDGSFVSVTMDGTEEEVSVSDLKRRYQKGATADQRLEESTTRSRELDEREQKIADREKTLETKPEVKPDEEEPKLSREDAKDQLVAALYDGEDDKAKEAIDALLPGESTAEPTEPVDTATLKEEVKSEIKAETEMDAAVTAFQTDYADIVKDPQLSNQADYFLELIMKEKSIGVAEALPLAGERTQEWIKELKGETEPEAQPTEREKKKLRKAAVDNLQSSGDKAKTTKVEDKPLTPSQTIAEMKKARGLPAY
jgi:hypothetical protein